MINLPNVFTAANMISGIVAIILAFAGRLDLAPFAIFTGAFFDFFDGFLARKMGVAGPMGKQLDSLADMVTFGVAPGIIMLGVMTTDPYELQLALDLGFGSPDLHIYVDDLIAGDFSNWLPLFSFWIPFFSIFRLAKFNIDERQTDRFIGLPTPANTLFFMTFPLVMSYGDPETLAQLDFLLNPFVLAGLCLVMSVLLVLEIPLFALKFKQFGWKGNQIRYYFLLISAGLIVVFKTWSIALIVFLYLILSLIENLINKNKTHEI